MAPPALRWDGDAPVRAGVRERPFTLSREGRTVPGVVWTPDPGHARAPLVLVGHGASGSARQDYVRSLARRLARHHGLAAAAIDGPVHGRRRPAPGAPPALVLAEFAQLWAAEGEAMTDAMVADWRATLDALVSLDEIDGDRAGWWGLSMGTILGLPLVAAEPRIAAAVLGLMGLTGPTRARLERDAPAVRCPVLFLVQHDDELFSLSDTRALFGALGSADKELRVHEGGHGAVPAEAFEESAAFLARRLLPPGVAPT